MDRDGCASRHGGVMDSDGCSSYATPSMASVAPVTPSTAAVAQPALLTPASTVGAYSTSDLNRANVNISTGGFPSLSQSVATVAACASPSGLVAAPDAASADQTSG